MITKITIDPKRDTLFHAVLMELPDLCNFFYCYPNEKVLVCHSDTFSGDDFLDELRSRRLITDYIKAEVVK